MLNAAAFLDPARFRQPHHHLPLTEAWSLAANRPASSSVSSLPDGSGRAVLVVPPFLSGDGMTQGLHAFLQGCGFQTFGWGLGVNWGPTPRILAGLERRLDGLAASGPVALAGVRPADILHKVEQPGVNAAVYRGHA